MATSGSSSISTRSFYGARAQAQHERNHFPVIETNFDKSEGESDSHKDELANIDEDESNYSSQSNTEESGDKSDAEVHAGGGDDSESAVEENNAARSSGTSAKTQSMCWRKRQPLVYDVTFKVEPFPPPPVEEYTPLQYFKQFFDDALIDHIVEHTNLYSVQSTGSSICVDHDVLGGAGNYVNHQIATNKDVLVQGKPESLLWQMSCQLTALKKSNSFFIVMTTPNSFQLLTRIVTTR